MFVRAVFILVIFLVATVKGQLFGQNDKIEISETSVSTASCKPCCSPCGFPCPFNQEKNEFLIRADLLIWKSSLSGLEGAFGTTLIEEHDNGAGQSVTWIAVQLAGKNGGGMGGGHG